MSNERMTRAWLEVDAAALRANLSAVRRAVGPRPALIPMVKADGYGVGAAAVVRALEPEEPWGYGVATATEGAALRDYGVRRPILVFSPLAPQSMERAAAAGLTVSISEVAGLEAWAAAAGRHGPLEFHTEVDTGLGRAGFEWSESAMWGERVAEVASSGAVRWRGAFTHFHSADVEDAEPTREQYRRFRAAVERLPSGGAGLMLHACNSAAALRWPELALDAVRPGIYLYGGNPALEAADAARWQPAPVVALRARVTLVREVGAGATVGYGATHAASRPERWATVSIGYGDGLSRLLGNRGSALVGGKRARFVGRISMDMLVVDITDIPGVEAGDAVTLVGRDGDAEISLEEVAAQAETISYDILTGLTPRVTRIHA
jgi:alanine racemase